MLFDAFHIFNDGFWEQARRLLRFGMTPDGNMINRVRPKESKHPRRAYRLKGGRVAGKVKAIL